MAIKDGGCIDAAGMRIQFWSFIYSIVVLFTAICQTWAIKNNFKENPMGRKLSLIT